MGNLLTYKRTIYDFLREFAQPYDTNQVPANNQGLNNDLKVNFPYITYNSTLENWDTDGLLQAYIYDDSDSALKIWTIASKMEEKIKEGYIVNDIIIHKGSPFAQQIPQEDKTIKCLYLNFKIICV